MFAISSRNSVPPSASSKQPVRSAFASVNAPFTWPNSSLSKTPSDEAARVDRDERPCRARATRAWSDARDDLLAGAVLAGDQHARVGRARRARRAPAPAASRATSRPARAARCSRARAVFRARAGSRRAARCAARAARAAWRGAARCPTASGCSRARRAASPRPRPRSLPHAVITTTGSVGSRAAQPARAGRCPRAPTSCRARSSDPSADVEVLGLDAARTAAGDGRRAARSPAP